MIHEFKAVWKLYYFIYDSLIIKFEYYINISFFFLNELYSSINVLNNLLKDKGNQLFMQK